MRALRDATDARRAGDDLQLRVHVLRGVRQRDGEPVPELFR